MTRNRILGTFALLGGLAYAAGGMRMLFFGYGEDVITDILGVIWAAGWCGGGWALLRLRVTGDSRAGRTVSAMLLTGFACALLWGCYRLMDPVAADRSPFALAPLLVILGMLGTGVLSVRTRRLGPWLRGLPLVIAGIYIVTVATAVATGQSTLAYAFTAAGVAYALLGRGIRTADAPVTTP